MNIKRKVLFVVAIIIIAILALGQNLSYSATGKTLHVGLTPERYVYSKTNNQYNQTGAGYKIRKNDGKSESETLEESNLQKVWQILSYTDKAKSAINGCNYYCLDVSAGTVWQNEDTESVVDYNEYYDLVSEKDTIAGLSSTTYNNVVKNNYGQLLWILDNIYIPDGTNESEKIALLTEAIAETDIVLDEEPCILTDADMQAVQQAVIWYFTNGYDNYESEDLLKISTDMEKYNSLMDYKKTEGEGPSREEQAEALYNYLVDSANKNASSYTSATGAPITIQNNTLGITKNGENYIVGPISISKNNDLSYTLNFAVTNGDGSAINEYYFSDSEGNTKGANVTIKNLVGQGEFYITVPAKDVTEVNVKISGNYSNTKKTLWVSSTSNNEQPIVEIAKETLPIEVNLKAIPETPKYFDLALRKAIIKVNEKQNFLNEAGNEAKRVVTYETSSLAQGTTATYRHRKDPVVVETGDTITYAISIYNESDISGYAKEIVDILPVGIVPKNTNGTVTTSEKGNKYSYTYDSTNNIITFVIDEANAKNLEPYAQGNTLDSETIIIECIVNQEASTTVSTYLTNIAYISKAYNAETKEEIILEKLKDRDSEPGTYPKYSASELNTTGKTYSGYVGNSSNNSVYDDTNNSYYYKGLQDDDDFEIAVVLPKEFDLKLMKYISAVNGEESDRTITVDTTNLNKVVNGVKITTADYNVSKTPIAVKNGDYVTYRFRIYNEGEVDGYAKEISEDIPEGLEFVYSKEVDYQNDSSLTEEDKKAIEFNANNYWSFNKEDLDENAKVLKVSTDYLAKDVFLNGTETSNPKDHLISAFDLEKDDGKGSGLSSVEVSIMLKVTASNNFASIITNNAAITEDTDKRGNIVDDRDSDSDENNKKQENWKKENSDDYYDEDKKWPKYEEDDEDYDNIVLKTLDLSLRKFIVAVSKDTTFEEGEYLTLDGTKETEYTRAPKVDVSKLNGKDENGKTTTTSIYNHSKEPVSVALGDYVLYTIRVYNEGELDGYASEITDYLPEYLNYIECNFNNSYGWSIEKDGKTIKTSYLKEEKLNAYDEEMETLDYKDVQILCRVNSKAKYSENITNIAEITEYRYEDGRIEKNDRDSTSDDLKYPEDVPGYKDDEIASGKTYIEGQEDDDDFEKVYVPYFDLALRKFITQVDDENITTRIPTVTYEDGKITYNHTKDPLDVVVGDIVTYTIRVYNEGEIAGFSELVSDDMPEYLEYLPQNETNIEYRWKMYDSEGNETQDVSKAVKITTDYTSKAYGEELMKKQNLEENPNLLNVFNPNAEISNTNPDYADVKVAFKVKDPNSSTYLIVNKAQITEDSDKNGKSVEDVDSKPDKWNEGEDDQDYENIKVQYFDLSLLKYVSQVIVTEDGKEVITETGNTGNKQTDIIPKVEIHRKKINSTVVKFKYTIKITNEGDIAGYAKEITDYVPDGLKFHAEDNTGWTDEGNNVISTTLLENTLLQPGESGEVTVIFRWINAQDNLALKTNWAEISKDDNDKDAPDIDSTPDNRVKGEDDIDYAEVILAISTGLGENIILYVTIAGVVLVLLASGIILIKKFVL